MLAGARSFVAVAEWAADTDPDTCAAVGLAGAVPSESMFRRVLQPLDAWSAAGPNDASDRSRGVAGIWRLTARLCTVSAPTDTPPRHLLAALDHDHGVLLAQVGVGAKAGEAPRLPVLLDGVDLADVVITAAAAHAQRVTAGFLHDRGTPYVLTVKQNQPTLFAQLTALPWHQAPTGSGPAAAAMAGLRPAKAVSVRAGIGFPHAARAVQIKRRRRGRTGRWHAGVAYAVTSLATHQASPANLGHAVRGHWHIENRLHWVRCRLTRTAPRFAPATAPRSWPARVTWRSPSSA